MPVSNENFISEALKRKKNLDYSAEETFKHQEGRWRVFE